MANSEGPNVGESNSERSSSTDARERIIAFSALCGRRIAERVVPIDEGVVVQTPTKRGVYSLNYIRIVRPTGFERLLELAEDHQRSLPYRYLIVEPPDNVAGLDEAFRAAGWEVDRDLMMELTHPPDREVATDVVHAAAEDEWLALMTRWHREEDPDSPPHVIAELDDFNRELSRALGDRLLGASLDGELAAVAMLRSDGTVAQVEDVYTRPEARGHGLARAVISYAVELARAEGHELVFILADADDWPRKLYAQIGFEPVGETRTYLLRTDRTSRDGPRRPPAPSAP